MDISARSAAADATSRPRPRMGLSGKLLVLTLLFVMVAEVLIYVPSVANFRLNWLNDRLSAAYTAALVFETAPGGEVPEAVARQILQSIRARAVALKMGQQRRLLAAGNMPPAVKHEIDMRHMSWHRAIIEACDTLFSSDADVMRVVGPAPMGGEFVEIVLDEAPLRKAMLDFSGRILILSLIISAITATLVYLALHRLLVRPMRRMTANMVAFRADPENPARIIAASERSDEIGVAERGLKVDADPDQLFRMLLNLARNAVQALETRESKDPGRDQIRVTGRREGAVVVVEVSDTGPGLSEKARAHLFEAFQGSTRTGSVGLGLAIVAELVRAHGGEIRLVEGTIGATFRLSIPDRAVDLDTHRGERARA